MVIDDQATIHPSMKVSILLIPVSTSGYIYIYNISLCVCEPYSGAR